MLLKDHRRRQLQRFFDPIEQEGAFLPYWPEMLDFELPENGDAETEEILEYHRSFGRGS
jgi:hypothetical protein